jgi:hypothetical protein
MRLGELEVNVPSVQFQPDIPVLLNAHQSIAINGLRVVVKMNPLQDKVGSIYLPSSEFTQEKYRAEVGTVVAASVGLTPGEQVIVRPYKGLWVDKIQPATRPEYKPTGLRGTSKRFLVVPDQPVTKIGNLILADIAVDDDVRTGWIYGTDRRILYSKHSIEKLPEGYVSVGKQGVYCEINDASLIDDMRFYGVTWDWEHEILAVWRNDKWLPLNDWRLVRRKNNSKTDSGLYIPNPGNKKKCAEAYDVINNEWLLCTDNTNVGIRMIVDGVKTDLEFIKEVDEDGFRNVYAVLEGVA